LAISLKKIDFQLEQEAYEDKNCFVDTVYKDELLTSAIFALLYAFRYCREFNKPPSTASSSLYVAAECRVSTLETALSVSYKPRRKTKKPSAAMLFMLVKKEERYV